MILALTALIAIVVVAGNQNGFRRIDNTTATTLANARIASKGTSGTITGENSETVVTAADLPAVVLTYLSTSYAGYTLVQAEQGTNGRDGSSYYEVNFTLNGTTQELHFDMAGVVLSPEHGGCEHGGGKGHGGGGGSSEVVIYVARFSRCGICPLSGVHHAETRNAQMDIRIVIYLYFGSSC